MGRFGAFGLIVSWETREVLGLMGKWGSKLKCSHPSQDWSIVNKDLFLPALIVGPFTKVTRGWAPVYSVTRGVLPWSHDLGLHLVHEAGHVLF